MRRPLLLSLPAIWVSLLSILAATPPEALAATPSAVNHQGLLVDTLGEPLDGTVDLTVRIWEHPTSTGLGDLAYFEDHLTTPVVDGVYSIAIGTGTSASGPFSASQFGDPDRWLELVVNGEVMAPRQKLLSVIYAFQAEICVDAATLGGLTSASIITSAQSSIPFSNLTGVIADAQVPASFTRDAEVMPLVLALDGPGSGLNADLLDGISSASFSQLGPTIESAEITDLTVATADLANASVTAAKLVDGAGSGVDADLFDALNSTSFLRSDVAGTFTGPSLTFPSTTTVDLNGTVRIGQDTSSDDDAILFDAGAESLTWSNAAARFDVSDDLRASSFALTTPITRSARIIASAFVPRPDDDEVWAPSSFGFGFIASGVAPLSNQLAAPVFLPAGASITLLSCSHFSSTAGASPGTGRLFSRSGTSTAHIEHAGFNFGAAGDASLVQITSDASIVTPTVSESSMYWITVIWTPSVTGSDPRFYGCSVEYQVTAVE